MQKPVLYSVIIIGAFLSLVTINSVFPQLAEATTTIFKFKSLDCLGLCTITNGTSKLTINVQEASYSNWNKITDVLYGPDNYNALIYDTLISDNGTILFKTTNVNSTDSQIFISDINGNIINQYDTGTNAGVTSYPFSKVTDQSITGLYQIMVNTNTSNSPNDILVYKNGILIKTISLTPYSPDLSSSSSSIAISPNGKYISIVGINSNSSRVLESLVYQGS